jgi:DNA primase
MAAMTTQWVNFKQIRESVSFEEILRGYGVELKVKGDQHQGYCPLPDHPGHQGKRQSPSFSVNLKRRIFQCFGCGAKGNAIDFVALMEGLDPQDPPQFRKAAMLIQERFLGGESASNKAPPAASTDKPPPASEDKPDDRPRVVNTPLDFTLTTLDPDHLYFSKRKLKPETVEYFGLGYASRGLMKDRIAIPLHDAEGRLVGYAGRLVDDAAISEEQPRYRFPGTRERDGTVHEFSKSMFLFNGHRIAGPVDRLIVVEGFFGTFWLHQYGWENVVALMGSSCGESQAELLIGHLVPSGRLWIMTDGDPAGRRCAADIMTLVAPSRSVRWARLEESRQPDDLMPDDLSRLLWPQS